MRTRFSLLMGLLMVVSVVPAAATASDVVELRGSTSVTVDRSIELLVDVPEGATLSDQFAVTVEGDGFAGLVLSPPDETGFSLQVMRYPGQATVRELTLAEADARSSATLLAPDATTRSCDGDCPVPAGRYSLVVVATAGEVTVSLPLDGLDGDTVVDVEDAPAAHLDRVTLDDQKIFDGPVASGGGGRFLLSGTLAPAGITFEQVRTHATSEVGGAVRAEHCVDVDLQCEGGTSSHILAPTAVTPDGLVSFDIQPVRAGAHGHQTTYSFTNAGDITLTQDLDLLWVYPRIWSTGV